MKITVRLHATLRKYLPSGSGGNDVVLDIPEGTTVAAILERLGVPPEHAGMKVCGDERLELTSSLRDGQELNLFPPLAGGS